MKKLLILLTFFGCLFLGLSSVDAATTAGEVDLREIETNTYIVGDRIYELNNYPISLYDIVNAAVEYANNHNGEMAPIYYYVGASYEDGFLIEYTGPIDPTTGIAPTKMVEIEDVYEDGIVNATAVNSSPVYDYISSVIEPQIVAGANELNQTALSKGFYEIRYDEETNTATFVIKDLNTPLSAYKDSGIVEIFTSIISGSKSLTYTVGNNTYGPIAKADMDESSEVIALAQILLQQMSGKTNNLLYADVANTKASATVTYEYEGFEHVDTFYLEFVYDIDSEKDKELVAAAIELDNKEDDGFYLIGYDVNTNTGTFDILELDRPLSSYKDSGIVALFTKFIKDAKSLTYVVNGTTYGPIAKADMDESDEVIALAQILLQQMTGKTTGMVYGDVIGKTASATVTYEIGGREYNVTYHLVFESAVEYTKDDELAAAAEQLDLLENDGFAEVRYNGFVKTGTFVVEDETLPLSSYKDSGIVTLFTTFIKDAKSLTYTVNGTTVGPIAKADMDESSEVIALAQLLLQQMTGKTTGMLYGDVVGKTASATVTYEVAGKEYQVTYHLVFESLKEVFKDVELENASYELSTKVNEGVSHIYYDKDINTGTFWITDETVELSTFKDSGIVTLFTTFIKDAKSLTYTVNGETVGPIAKENMDESSEVIALAQLLLQQMSGKTTGMVYGDVIGKTASATVIYEVEDKEYQVTYNLEFKIAE